MKITNVRVENYRSIQDLKINLSDVADVHCRILAGINESGKSNVLRALSLLSSDAQVVYTKDINKKARRDKKTIRIHYALTDDAFQLLKQYLAASSVPEEIITALEITAINRVVEFDSASSRSDYYHIWLRDAPAVSGYEYSSTKGFSNSVAGVVMDETEVDVAQTPASSSIAAAATSAVAPAAAVVAKTDDYTQISTKEEWEQILEDNFASAALESNMPKAIFWEYKPLYLINEPIDLTAFSANPTTTSRPLHNVFHLAGYTDEQIASTISDALEDGAAMAELADKLGMKTTEYLKEVWPEHKVAVKVHTDKPSITFHVIDETESTGSRFEVAERSDGFKHFFAILLNLAAENKTAQLKDSLILLDEPELHLHPSGARFLRDELLKIARNNTVVYSTHSVFMIDKTCLPRHYKVFKQDEQTQIDPVDDSSPFKEELVYEALGTSVLELISGHNLLVEGLTDKKLLEAFTRKFKLSIKPLDINVVNVDGESNFDKYCKFFNRNIIKGYILADADKDGANAKKRIIQSNTEYTDKNVFTINDITETSKMSALEDLLPSDVVQKCILDSCDVSLPLDQSKTLKEQLTNYNKQSDKKIDENALKMSICDFVCADIVKSGMTLDKTKDKYATYHAFVTALHQKLKDDPVVSK